MMPPVSPLPTVTPHCCGSASSDQGMTLLDTQLAVKIDSRTHSGEQNGGNRPSTDQSRSEVREDAVEISSWEDVWKFIDESEFLDACQLQQI